MRSVLRSFRTQPPQGVFSSPLPYNCSRKSPRNSFKIAAAAGTNLPESGGGGSNMEMEQKSADEKKPNVKKGDTMSSFGEGYATRSDEEGFGGTYGGNYHLDDDEQPEKEKVIHHEHDEFDKKQGSEVKETEKSRHQKHANSN